MLLATLFVLTCNSLTAFPNEKKLVSQTVIIFIETTSDIVPPSPAGPTSATV